VGPVLPGDWLLQGGKGLAVVTDVDSNLTGEDIAPARQACSVRSFNEGLAVDWRRRFSGVWGAVLCEHLADVSYMAGHHRQRCSFRVNHAQHTIFKSVFDEFPQGILRIVV